VSSFCKDTFKVSWRYNTRYDTIQ